jgi:Cys-tRNA(Pro) deacylase
LTKFPVTPAITILDNAKIEYTPHFYEYREFGAVAAANQLDVDAHLMIKTLVMETETHEPFIVLMHGEKTVSTKELARQLQVKTVSACSPQDAQRYTGYRVGGISPFGTKRPLPIYIEKTILTLPKLYINAGRRGFLIEMTPSELTRILHPKLVSVAR